MSQATEVTCLECGTLCGGENGKDTYAHMLGCLHVEPGAVERIREAGLASRTVNGERVVHLCNALLTANVPPSVTTPDS